MEGVNLRKVMSFEKKKKFLPPLHVRKLRGEMLKVSQLQGQSYVNLVPQEPDLFSDGTSTR
jgi:hypothetical protein